VSSYYNENDPKIAAWLRCLIDNKVIPSGEVDERSIEDVRPNDLRGFRHCHFFAGIGGWAEALRLAEWPEDREVWTGSCPCQPFSAAGKRTGDADERHLWPAWFHLIEERRPAVVFGEQVDAAVKHGWLDLFTLTWKELVTPMHRPLFLLRASVRRMVDTEFSSWPTPTVNDSRGGRNRTSSRSSEHSKHHDGVTLCDAVQFIPWATPKASDGSGGRTTRTVGGGNAHLDLQARSVISGAMPTGSDAQTGVVVGARLSLEHSRWLMGYRTEWSCCGDLAMQLIRKPARHSSSPISKRLPNTDEG